MNCFAEFHFSPPSRLFPQLSNEFNARKLTTELWVFEGVLSHPLFLIIMIGTGIVQIILVEFGGTAFNTVHLSAEQFFISFAIGMLSLPWSECDLLC
jgi:hypothetical protein